MTALRRTKRLGLNGLSRRNVQRVAEALFFRGFTGSWFLGWQWNAGFARGTDDGVRPYIISVGGERA
jgi:hypothetical protein